MDTLTYLSVEAAGSLPGSLALLFALLIGHALADFGLQNEFIARNKIRDKKIHPGESENSMPGLWIYVITSHALIHAGVVWVITGGVAFAVAEFFLHGIIDHLRGRGLFSLHIDQLLHVLCKAAYVLILFFYMM